MLSSYLVIDSCSCHLWWFGIFWFLVFLVLFPHWLLCWLPIFSLPFHLLSFISFKPPIPPSLHLCTPHSPIPIPIYIHILPYIHTLPFLLLFLLSSALHKQTPKKQRLFIFSTINSKAFSFPFFGFFIWLPFVLCSFSFSLPFLLWMENGMIHWSVLLGVKASVLGLLPKYILLYFCNRGRSRNWWWWMLKPNGKKTTLKLYHSWLVDHCCQIR